MYRKFVGAIIAVAILPSVLATTEAGAAQSNPVILPGTVTCSNNWTGTIAFVPPLRTAGVSPHEVFKITATLGNSANPCTTSLGGVQLGKIKGALKFMSTGGTNKCATVFGGSTLVPVAGRFKLTWTSPPGAPTIWKQLPLFSVVGGFAGINVGGGAVTGSFTPYPTPSATLAGPVGPWGSAAITAACATASGLTSLPLGVGSTGSW